MLRCSRVLLALLTTCLVAGAVPASAREAPLGQDPIVPGASYRGDFPDPGVVRAGSTYYAVSTSSGGLNVPSLASHDLRTWYARRASAASPAGDALPRVASWAAGVEQPDGRFRAPVWAPSLARIGPGRWVLAYATKLRGSPYQRMCISVATGTSPAGPFVDRSTKPLVCPLRGAIDPYVFVAPNGRPWLLWKIDRSPARIYTQMMDRTGTRLSAFDKRHYLMGAAQAWERGIVENPAMVRYRGRYYLFYSGNDYATTRYAIGYLVCRTWYGGCVRPRKRPLMPSMLGLAGPGGGSPVIDTAGRLRLAYHAWTAGAVGYPDSLECRATLAGCGQRRLYVAWLDAPRRTGYLFIRAAR
ncbi:MAG: family 43 glycosylhydrolase [Nocardioidaceae bacterium]|nr:family 43 glycosylhydrolase [Nocardioidaceae bacterium]